MVSHRCIDDAFLFFPEVRATQSCQLQLQLQLQLHAIPDQATRYLQLPARVLMSWFMTYLLLFCYLDGNVAFMQLRLFPPGMNLSIVLIYEAWLSRVPLASSLCHHIPISQMDYRHSPFQGVPKGNTPVNQRQRHWHRLPFFIFEHLSFYLLYFFIV